MAIGQQKRFVNDLEARREAMREEYARNKVRADELKEKAWDLLVDVAAVAGRQLPDGQHAALELAMAMGEIRAKTREVFIANDALERWESVNESLSAARKRLLEQEDGG